MANRGQLIKLGIRSLATPPLPPSPPPDYDYIVYNRTQLLAVLDNDLTNKVVYVADDCAGAELVVSNKTWPGAVFRGTSAGVRPIVCRLTFRNCNGSSGNPITLKWLDLYNVCTSPPGGTSVLEAQITFDTSASTYFQIIECALHDDPFATKSFKGGNKLAMYRGIGCTNNGTITHLTVQGCEIYNQNRSFIKGDDVLVEGCQFHDHYNNAVTFTGNNHTYRDLRCWNMWAYNTDTGSPHASMSISFQPSGTADMSDILCEGIVAIVGTARYEYDGVFPIGLGFELNDMVQTGFNYVRCTVRNCLTVGSSNIQLEFDGGVDCVSEWNTFALDVSQRGSSLPIIYSDANDNVIHRYNITYNYSQGVDGRGTVYLYQNATASPAATGSDNLIAYENIFVGQGGATPYGFIVTCDDALTAFALKGTHPYASWTIIPGAVNGYYNWSTGSGSWPATSVPTSNNATSQSASAVTKPSSAALRKTTTGGAWVPSNLRQFTMVFKLSNDATINDSTRQALSISNGTIVLERLSTDVWRFNVDDAASSADMITASSTFETTSADGLVVVAVSWDIDQAKFQMKFAANGVIQQDFATLSLFRGVTWGAAGGNTLTVGDANGAVPTASAFVGQIDTLLMKDSFTDMETSAGLAEVFNTSGGLADLSAQAASVGVYVHTDATTYNTGNANSGNGTGGGGAATTLTKTGTGSFS